MESIEERLIKTVSDQLGVAVPRIKPESTLQEDLGADSLDLVMLALAVEDEFDIEIPDDDAEKFKTVGDLTTYILDAVVA